MGGGGGERERERRGMGLRGGGDRKGSYILCV